MNISSCHCHHSFALTRLDSLRSKLEQSVDAFIKARKELEEIFVRKTFSLVLNLYNRRKCLCLHHILRLRDCGFLLHTEYSLLTWLFLSDYGCDIFLLCSFISKTVSYLFPFSHYFLCVFVVFLLSPCSCILISQQRAAVNKDVSSLDLLLT